MLIPAHSMPCFHVAGRHPSTGSIHSSCWCFHNCSFQCWFATIIWSVTSATSLCLCILSAVLMHAFRSNMEIFRVHVALHTNFMLSFKAFPFTGACMCMMCTYSSSSCVHLTFMPHVLLVDIPNYKALLYIYVFISPRIWYFSSSWQIL